MGQKISVILYTRPGCHLCEVAKTQILAAQCADLYELQEVNIETDPELVERYGTLIPVITVNGEDRFRYRVSPAEFRESVLKAAAAST